MWRVGDKAVFPPKFDLAQNHTENPRTPQLNGNYWQQR